MELDDYHLLSQVGAGVDGASYRGIDRRSGTAVEIRVLSAAGEEKVRRPGMEKRLRGAMTLVHRGAARIRGLFLDREPAVVTLDWPGATSLDGEVRGRLPLPVREIVAIGSEILPVLAEAHRLGLAHGRIRAGNIRRGDDGILRLEFSGLRTWTTEGGEFGEGGAPPDRESGPDLSIPDSAHDVRLLGEMFAWLWTGRPAPTDPGRFSSSGDVHSSLGRLIRAMLEDDPASRPSAREVIQALGGEKGAGATGGVEGPASATVDFLPSEEMRETAHAPAALVQLSRELRPARIGRFRLLEELGHGGQGVVYKAEDTADGAIVAVKVLNTQASENRRVLQRFRKEARMLAAVSNPHVVQLLEFNDEEGLPYLVMEYVTGQNLEDMLRSRGRLDEATALEVMADVARGLCGPHERGIVHRDVKPANIMLLEPANHAISSECLDNARGSADDIRPVVVGGARMPGRVKLSDFGLARFVEDSESMAVTAAGAIVGTPHYMAPEQCTARKVDPRTDVYAMGVTMFHALAGRVPFLADTRDAILEMHCHEPVPSLSRVNPEVSEGACRIVARAMAKEPNDRYADAAEMLRDLDRLIRGEPAGIPAHPILPAIDPARTLTYEFRWELDASPRQLWPHVTNTDRVDRAIGFTPVRYTMKPEPGRRVRTIAEGMKAGMSEVGEEFPYEWVEPERMGVLREYSEGPFVWLVSTVELLSRPEGGTTLIHRLRLEPRNWMIKLISPCGIGVRLRDDLGKVYRRIDAAVSVGVGRSEAADPFERPPTLTVEERQRLDQGLDRLGRRGVDPALVERLGGLLSFTPAPELARIRPIVLARRWGLEPDQVVAAFLHAAEEGLLVLLWDLICPSCRIPSEVKDSLRSIREHGHCPACDLDYVLDFASSVELVFRSHPQIRRADTAIYCVGGPAHSPHVLAQVRIAPGEHLELEVSLPEGHYRVRGPQLPWSFDFRVQPEAAGRRLELELLHGPGPDASRALRPGRQLLEISNGGSFEVVVRIERSAFRSDAYTAARATSLALFRELFPGEVLSPGQLVSVSSVTLLATAIEQVQRIYAELGDAPGFAVVFEHLRLLGERVRLRGGAVVKTVGEGLLASFSDPISAVQCALEFPEVLSRTPMTSDLALRIAIHRGPTFAATINDQLDYFGSTVRSTGELLTRAVGGEVVMSPAVAGDPGVATLLQDRQHTLDVLSPILTGQIGPILRIRAGPVMPQVKPA